MIAHGKETDRQWQEGEDISFLFPLLPEYCPNETTRMVSDPNFGDQGSGHVEAGVGSEGGRQHTDGECRKAWKTAQEIDGFETRNRAIGSVGFQKDRSLVIL